MAQSVQLAAPFYGFPDMLYYQQELVGDRPGQGLQAWLCDPPSRWYWLMRPLEIIEVSIEKTGHPLATSLVMHIHTAAEFASVSEFGVFADWVELGQADSLNAEPALEQVHT